VALGDRERADSQSSLEVEWLLRRPHGSVAAPFGQQLRVWQARSPRSTRPSTHGPALTSTRRQVMCPGPSLSCVPHVCCQSAESIVASSGASRRPALLKSIGSRIVVAGNDYRGMVTTEAAEAQGGVRGFGEAGAWTGRKHHECVGEGRGYTSISARGHQILRSPAGIRGCSATSGKHWPADRFRPSRISRMTSSRFFFDHFDSEDTSDSTLEI
jgi:hypothetical protein